MAGAHRELKPRSTSAAVAMLRISAIAIPYLEARRSAARRAAFLVCNAIGAGQNAHGARIARDVLPAPTGMVGQDTCVRARCIAATITIAIAIDVGAVIVVVGTTIPAA
jgi:hypothetical protein